MTTGDEPGGSPVHAPASPPGAAGRRAARAALTVAVAAGVAYGLFRIGAATAPARVAEGAPAPDFMAATLDSIPQARTLADYRGSPLLLNIWATWCDPCREEMPSIQRLYEAYRAKGLRVVAISVDDRGTESLIREFVADHHLTFDVVHEQHPNVMTAYQVRGIPQTFLISRDGRIVATRFAADWASTESRHLVDSLLFGDAAAR